MSNSATKIAFLSPAIDNSWLGGISYLRNLFSLLENTNLSPVLFTGELKDPSLLADFPDCDVVITPFLKRKTLPWALRKTVEKLTGRDYFLEQVLKQHQISLISHTLGLGLNCQIPKLGWIPDLQHKHLPELFDKRELKFRDLQFQEICKKSNLVLMSSNSAKEDLKLHFPEGAFKARTFPFVALPEIRKLKPADTTTDASDPLQMVLKKYNLPTKFFYLPNQFWAHKNHKLVAEALKILKEQNKDIIVVATGNTSDHRQKEYFDSLLLKIKNYQLESNFRILGIIPFSEVKILTKSSLALINPSFFEGWSTTVEEAKALGKKILLSNIPVHREQNPPRGVYFDPHNSEELALRLSEAWDEASHGLNNSNEAQHLSNAVKELELRKSNLLSNYQAIIKEVVNS